MCAARNFVDRPCDNYCTIIELCSSATKDRDGIVPSRSSILYICDISQKGLTALTVLGGWQLLPRQCAVRAGATVLPGFPPRISRLSYSLHIDKFHSPRLSSTWECLSGHSPVDNSSWLPYSERQRQWLQPAPRVIVQED